MGILLNAVLNLIGEQRWDVEQTSRPPIVVDVHYIVVDVFA